MGLISRVSSRTYRDVTHTQPCNPEFYIMADNVSELACTYAALILHGEGVPIEGDSIKKLISAAGVNVESFWPDLFAGALHGCNIGDLISNISSGAAAPAAGAAVAGGAAAEGAKKEEKKEEEEEEEEEDMDVGGFFGGAEESSDDDSSEESSD